MNMLMNMATLETLGIVHKKLAYLLHVINPPSGLQKDPNTVTLEWLFKLKEILRGGTESILYHILLIYFLLMTNVI